MNLPVKNNQTLTDRWVETQAAVAAASPQLPGVSELDLCTVFVLLEPF